MTERRRRRRRGESNLIVGVAVGFGLALLSIMAADMAGHRMPRGVQQAILSIDPLAGRPEQARPEPAPTRFNRAGMGLGGEIILDGPGDPPAGQLRLDDSPAIPAGSVLENVAPGEHQVSLVRDGVVVWRQTVNVEEAGSARLLFPDESAGTPMAHRADAPPDSGAYGLPRPAPADSALTPGR